MMNNSKIENIQPEPQPNNAVKADGLPSAQVEQNPMLAVVPVALNNLAKAIHHNNIEKGFYENPKNIGEMICLIHSEVSEALEADRKGKYCNIHPIMLGGIADANYGYTFHNDKVAKEHYELYIKGTFEEEMADIFIRVLDMCAYKGIDIVAHVSAKIRYNKSREKYHGKKY